MLSKKINKKKGVGEGVRRRRCSCCIAAAGAVAAAASAAATPTPATVCPSFAHPRSQPVLVRVHSHARHGCCRTRLPLGPHSALSVCARPRLSAPASFVCAHRRPRSSVRPVVVYVCPHRPSRIRACACACLYAPAFVLARMRPSFVLAGPCFSRSFALVRARSFVFVCPLVLIPATRSYPLGLRLSFVRARLG
jgi:hypothetical protein